MSDQIIAHIYIFLVNESSQYNILLKPPHKDSGHGSNEVEPYCFCWGRWSSLVLSCPHPVNFPYPVNSTCIISSLRTRYPKYLALLYRYGCFTGKYTTRKIHTKLHPGPEWRIFHILTSEDFVVVISRFSRLFVFGWLFVYITKKKHYTLARYEFFVLTISHSYAVLTTIYFLLRGHKSHIFLSPCNILYKYPISHKFFLQHLLQFTFLPIPSPGLN